MPQYKLTTLDDCPTGSACQYEIDSACNFKAAIRLCSFHQAKKDSGLTDAEVFDDLHKGQQARETARWIAKVSLGLDKEHPGVPFKVEQDGIFTIGKDALDNLMSGWPTAGAKRNKLVQDIMAAISTLEKSTQVRIA
jgi:hypothetical protein